jgi:hypothetical protein
VIRKFEFGELNPNIVARSGPQLDPARFSAYHVQQKLIDNYLSPSGFQYLQGPLRGIVLRIEKPTTSFLGGFLGETNVSKEPLTCIKVRIPEIHPFPDPNVYGPEGEDSVISLYPTFVAVSPDLPTPAVGEIVYVDYGDRENFEDPRYYGIVSSKPIYGGTNQTIELPKQKASLFNRAKNSLKDFLTPPSNTTQEPVVQEPNTPKECKENPTQNQLFQPDLSSCFKEDTVAGQYDLYVKGEKIGTANMVVWTNKDGTRRLVRDDVIHTIEKMSQDMKAEIGVNLRLNSGFRQLDTQQCMYDKYLKCKAEWTKAGKKGLPPTAIGDPNLAGPNSHVNGRASDFQTDVGVRALTEAKETKSKAEIIAEAKEGNFSKTWQWLINNSQKYGWVWTGFSFNEPWHFEFNETVARASGIYPKT